MELARMEMHVVERLSECESNLVKLSTDGWISAMVMNFQLGKGQSCCQLAASTAYLVCTRPGEEALVMPIVPRLCATLVKIYDRTLQVARRASCGFPKSPRVRS